MGEKKGFQNWNHCATKISRLKRPLGGCILHKIVLGILDLKCNLGIIKNIEGVAATIYLKLRFPNV